MIGNDVVDLLQSRKDSNWQRKGYIEKIFNPEEQLYISNASDPEIMVWALWSMKEAAYKVYNRKTKVREYIPKKLNCFIESQNEILITGKVICSENTFHTRTILSNDFIHTVAVSFFDDLNNVIEIENKAIDKDKNGIPFLAGGLQNIAQDVSISHHGRFEKVVTLSQP
jgi:phosphopantetheinyl transferase (holo-ACP synthase)